MPFATLAGYNGEVSLKSAYKKPLANSLADVERNVVSGESAQITPNEDARLAPNNRSIEVADRQLADNFTGATTNYSVANNSRNVNEDVKYKLNPEHEAQVRAYNEHITRLRQREEYLRGQGMSENAPAMINLRKAQEQAIYARDHIGEVDENGLKYKLGDKERVDTQMQELTSQNNLLARHLQLTGDENLVFNEWQNEMQKKALGYYDPKTDQINLNKLTEDTLNHELGHKLLTRVENKQELLNSIRESYGDDYLINKYGNQYGNDLNLLAEEQLADGFSDYYNGRLNGEDKVRLGVRLGIPQKVLAIYDRITEAIMGLVGKQDAIKQFYAQMETGKFRNAKQQVPGGDGRVRTMSIQQSRDGTPVVVIENDILAGVPARNRARVINKYFKENLQGNNYDLDYGKDGTARISAKTRNKYLDPGQTVDDLIAKGKMAGELPDILRISKKVGYAADTKNHGFAAEGFEYRQAIVKMGESTYKVRLNVGINSKGKLLYAVNGIEKIPESHYRDLSGDSSSSTISNQNENVNTDNRYQHPLQETINEMEANPKPRMTRELREAIDEFIYENIDQNLFLEHNDTNILGSHGLTWSIPRLHVDDLRHHLFNNNAIVLELSVEMVGNHMLLEEGHVHIMVE